MGKREQPLTIAITTAGVGRTGHRLGAVCVRQAGRRPARSRIRRSCRSCSSRPRASTGATRRSGPTSTRRWACSAVFEEMQTSAKRAEHVPAQQAAFRQLYLNEWRDGSATPWLDLAIWDEGEQQIDPEDINPGTRAGSASTCRRPRT